MNEQRYKNLTEAMFDTSMPINPIPFAIGLADLVKERGTNFIKSDEAKKILWVLLAQSYGELSMIDLSTEWKRLYERD
tara:strand:+ start:2370 stop:2603 length:234 start_codon:yes stop_codon:yes gene_type:complete